MQASRRETVDLSEYPDLTVIVLGIRAGSLRSLPALLGVGRGLSAVQRDPPEGLLSHEPIRFGWNHIGFRQYWRDVDTLHAFTRTMPHSRWWSDFTKDARGCGFWHETYSARGGMEAVYVGMPEKVGFARFAPVRAPVGPFLSSRDRLRADADQRADPR